MATARPMRWLCLSAVLGAGLMTVHEVLFGIVVPRFTEAPTLWSVIYAFGMFGALFLLLGIIAIVARLGDRLRPIGVLAFVIGIVGLTAFISLAWGGVAIIPAIVSYDAAFMTAELDSWLFLNLFLITHILLAVGVALMGVAAWVGRLAPRISSILMVVGSVVGFVDSMWDLGPIDPPFGAMILGSVGIAWMAVTVWRQR